MRWYDSQEISYDKAKRRSVEEYVTPLSQDLQDELRGNATGYVILPGDPMYDGLRQGHNKDFDTFPAVIVKCLTEADVRLCLRVGEASGLSVVARSGGHSTAGFSSLTNAIVVDMSDYNNVWIHEDKTKVTVGAGCNFRKLNGMLEDHNLHLTGGSCNDVCVAGYMMGGGYGWSSRLYGMNCDLVESAEVMLTDGIIVVASNDQNKELFRALRGGTGSNFGILLNVTYHLQNDAVFEGFSVRWSLETEEDRRTAAEAMHIFQRKIIPNELRMGIQILWSHNQGVTPDGKAWKPQMMMRGVFRPEEGVTLPPYQVLLDLPGAELEYAVEPLPYTKMNVRLLTTPYSIPQITAEQHATIKESKLSRILDAPLPQEVWLDLMNKYIETPNPYTLTAMEVYGGAISDEVGGPTVFVHRKGQIDFFVDVFWWPGEDPEEEKRVKAELEQFLEDMMALLGDHWNGGVYQNYPNVNDAEFAGHYWGDLYPELAALKQKYDPKNILRYPQGIGVVRGKPSDNLPTFDDPIVPRPA